MNATSPKQISLAEFKSMHGPEGFDKLLSRINGGTFMDCHKLIAREMGVWVPELVPIFQKLDAMLATRPLPAGLKAG